MKYKQESLSKTTTTTCTGHRVWAMPGVHLSDLTNLRMLMKIISVVTGNQRNYESIWAILIETVR